MTLVDESERMRSGFDSADLGGFLDLVERIRGELRTEPARQYLAGKVAAARSAAPAERRRLCRALLPYLDWYISGKCFIYNPHD